jgi:hypothetical protein
MCIIVGQSTDDITVGIRQRSTYATSTIGCTPDSIVSPDRAIYSGG